MKRKYKKNFLLISALVLAVLLVGCLGITYLVKTSKNRLEQAVSARLNMQVTSSGLRVSFLMPTISAQKVVITNNGSQVARIAKLRVGLNPLDLLRGQIRITTIRLEAPELDLGLLRDFGWNIMLPDREKDEEGTDLPEVIEIKNGSLILKTAESSFALNGMDLEVRDLVRALDKGKPLLQRLSLTGDLHSKELRWNEFIISDFSSKVDGTKGHYVFEPLGLKTLRGAGKGRISVDLDTENIRATATLELIGFRVEDFFTALAKEGMFRGAMNFTLNLSADGKNLNDLRHTMGGQAEMTGKNLTITGFNLDNLLEEYIQTQNFNLVDLGAYAVIGPLGPAITKAYDFSGLATAGHGGTTVVRELVSRWKIEQGMVRARDVALATTKNRIALDGSIDIGAKRFQKLVVAVVDDKGCSLVRQEINGFYGSPEIERPNFLETVTAPLINTLNGAAKIIIQEDCEVFYEGSVAVPDG